MYEKIPPETLYLVIDSRGYWELQGNKQNQITITEAKMQKWEYMTLSLLPDDKQIPQWTDAPEDSRSASERLNELGEEGWELVSVAQHIEGDKRRTVYWLKRPVE